MTKTKVAILSRNFKSNAGGGEHYAVSLTEKLTEEYDIHIFSQNYDEIDGATFHTVPTPFRRPRWINLLWFNLYTWVKCRKFPIIHTHEMVPFANVVTMHVRCSTPNFSQYRGLKRLLKKLKFFTSIRKLTYLWLEKEQLKPKENKHIVVVSEILKNNIRDVYQYSTNQYIVIPPGVDQPEIINPNKARNILNIPEENFYLLLVSNDFISKGLKPLIKSLSLLPENIHLLVAGNDQQTPFKQLAEKLNISHRILFLGSRKDMNTIYSACDILVHPSTFDTYGMVALEAMSHEKPVIISDSNYCGISHEITNQAILLRNPEDPDEISNSIRTIYLSEKYKNKLIKNGKKFIEDKSWRTTKSQYARIYNHILKHKQRKQL